MSARHLVSGQRAKQSVKWNDHVLEDVEREDAEAYAESEFGGFKDYDRRKRIKLQNQDALLRARARDAAAAQATEVGVESQLGQGSGGKHDLFRGMVIHINGYTKPSRVTLWHLIVVHGGVYKQYLEGKTDVTHILATNLTPKKQEEFRKYRVVRPEWVTLSIEAGKVLPWQDFRVVDEGPRQLILGSHGGGQDGSGAGAVRKNDLDSSYKRKQAVVGFVTRPQAEANTQGEGAQRLASVNDEPAREAAQSPDLIAREPCPEPEAAKAVESDNTEIREAPAEAPVPRAAATRPVVPTDAEQEDRGHAKTAVDPDFIEDYYRKSRLHHLSTWKSTLRTKIHNLALAARPHNATGQQKMVMHIDFDCFFAAVSARDRPDLKDKPCAVTHGGSNSGEIASCNYAARAFGVYNGMWMKNAIPLCPDIVSLPYDFDAYEEASEKFYDILLGVGAEMVEAVSIDEALVDLTNLLPDPAHEHFVVESNAFVANLRKQITDATGVEVSAGLGANVLQAKLATKKAKPAGQLCVSQAMVADLLHDVKLVSVPGIGDSTATKLEDAFRISTLSEAAAIPTSRLQEVLGPKNGVTLAQAAQGLDDYRVGNVTPRKIVSIEINWGIRFFNDTQVEDYMTRLSDALCKKLHDVGFVSAKHVLVKVMRRARDAPIDPPKFLGHGKCDRFNNGREISESGDAKVIKRHAHELLRALGIPPDELRGIGVALTRLRPVGASVFKQALMKQHQQPVVFQQVERETASPPAAFEPATPIVDRPVKAPGTQFILPSQIDPSVIEHLPQAVLDQIEQRKLDESDFNPSLSQVAAEDLAALPASVRKELMLQHQQQQRLLRSPTRRKTDISKFVVKTPSPKKDRTTLASAAAAAAVANTLTQAFSRTRSKLGDAAAGAQLKQAALNDIDGGLGGGVDGGGGIDKDVLAALPEDIRREVIAEDRRRRAMERRKRIRDKQRVKLEAKEHDAKKQRWENRKFLELPAPRGSFSRSSSTAASDHQPYLSTVDDGDGEGGEEAYTVSLGDLGNESIDGVRDYLRDWVSSTEAPEEEDWLEFRNYIAILLDRRDLNRVAGIVSYLALVVARPHDGGGGGGGGGGEDAKVEASMVWRQYIDELVGELSDTIRL